MNKEIKEHLLNFEPITLREMQDIRLMNRTDTKFITSIYNLPDFLEFARNFYYVQEIEEMRSMPYATLYYDTLSRDMYRIHHNGKKNRQKIRIRTYAKSNLSFLEVKNKNNKGKTRKIRVAITDESVFERKDTIAFLVQNTNYEIDRLKPHLENQFQRITLVNKGKTERLTIDYNISFHNRFTNEDSILSHLVIIELKREGHAYSPLSKIKRKIHLSSTSISKYCIGTVLTDPTIKRNRLKMKLRKIMKLTQQKTINT